MTEALFESHGEMQRYVMSVFIQDHRGYLWKEVISSQPVDPGHLDFLLRSGGYLWDPLARGYTSTLKADPSEIVSKPHILGSTRELELQTR